MDNLTKRLPTGDQGRALQALSHAIEHIMASRASQGLIPSEKLAIETLAKLNRQIFLECKEHISFEMSLQTLFARIFGVDSQ